MRPIDRRFAKLEKIFAPVVESEDRLGRVAEFRDESSRAQRPLLISGQSWRGLAHQDAGSQQLAATSATTASCGARAKTLPKRWRGHSGLIRTS